jgi:hypothetical protein
MASESGFDGIFSGPSVNAERDTGGDALAQAVDQTAPPRNQQ